MKNFTRGELHFSSVFTCGFMSIQRNIYHFVLISLTQKYFEREYIFQTSGCLNIHSLLRGKQIVFLLTLARSSHTVLDESVENRFSWFVPGLRAAFDRSPQSVTLTVASLHMPFILTLSLNFCLCYTVVWERVYSVSLWNLWRFTMWLSFRSISWISRSSCILCFYG